VVPLEARSVAEATERLTERLVEQGAVTDPGRLRGALRRAHLEDVVSVGTRFLPHVRHRRGRPPRHRRRVAPTPIAWGEGPQRTAAS
jgi:hypothetical protein